MLHELAAEHFGLDTKVARTLVTLLRYPGRLTQEYLAGRRVRYLPPLRLYLSLSVLFFLCSAARSRLTGSSNASNIIRFNTSGAAGKGSIISFDTTALGQSGVADSMPAMDSRRTRPGVAKEIGFDTLHGNALSLFLKRRLARRAAYMQSHTSEATARVTEAFDHDIPDALFLLVPGLALALSMLYFSSHRFFAEHLVFALHFQAFAFAALTIGLLPIPFLDVIVPIAVLVYLFIALRSVYGRSIGSTTVRLAAIVVGYGVSLATIMGFVAATVFLFA
jgi:hypothetical protein